MSLYRPRVLLLADDLSGAADAGVPFAARGLTTTVHLGIGRGAEADDVMAFDLDIRDGDARMARRRVRDAARAGQADVTFGKLDSLLRGHVLEQLQGLRDAQPDALIVLAPAFPAAGRTTVDGDQLVHGVPTRRRLLDLLAPLRTVAVGLADVRAGMDANVARMDADVAVCDAETDDDLAAVVKAIRRSGRTVVWAGSAGLALAVAEDLSPRPRKPPTPLPFAGAGPVMTVIGSWSAIAGAQAASLAAAGATSVVLAADRLLKDSVGARSRLRATVIEAGQIGDVVVSVGGPVARERSAELLDGLVAVVAEAARTVSLLVLTGGATARAILLAGGVDRLLPAAELETGVVLSRAPHHDLTVVTKAGAFGDANTLTRAVRAVRRGAQP